MKKALLTSFFAIAAVMFSFAQKFAYVDTEYILSNISEYKAAQEQLDKIAVDWQKEIEQKFAEIDKLYKDFQAEAVLLPEEMKKKKENEIINKEKEAKDLQKQRFGKDGDLFKKRQQLVKPIQDKVFNAVEEVANQKGLAIVFDKSGSLTMVYANAKHDISDEILDKLGYKAGTIRE